MDGYIRVSRVGAREGPGYISPSVQREQIEGWAKLRQVEIAEWHEDFDQSGGKLSRPGLDALLIRIEANQTEGVIVAKLDRLSRLGVPDALKLVERITSAGATLAALDLGIDPTTPTGELMLTLLLAMARMERRRLIDSWSIARQRAIERGAKVSPTPYGYERGDDGVLSPHPTESLHVIRAYELAASHGINAAVAYLCGHAPGRTWRTHTVRRMLKRRCYLGEAFHGDHTNTTAHDPLVSRRLWEAAQTEPKYRIVRKPEDYPLSGIPHCGTCGNRMVAGPKTSTGKRAYRCSAAQTLYKGERCTKPANIIADYLEQHLRERLKEVRPVTVSVADGNEELALAERAMLDAEHELDSFAADLTLRRALGNRYHDHLTTRVQHLDDARSTYRTLARRAEHHDRSSANDIFETPILFAEFLRSMDISIFVRPGRGTMDDRVFIAPFDGELPSWVEDRADPKHSSLRALP